DFSLLRRLTTRHDVMMVRIADADPLQRESLDHDVVDVDNPREVASLARSSKRVARDVEAYRRARREGISEMMDRLHISHLLTQGETTVVDDMIAMLRAREYRHGPGWPRDGRARRPRPRTADHRPPAVLGGLGDPGGAVRPGDHRTDRGDAADHPGDREEGGLPRPPQRPGGAQGGVPALGQRHRRPPRGRGDRFARRPP